MPRMWLNSMMLIAPLLCPPSFMCSGVRVMVPTIVAWLTIIASTASRALGFARISLSAALNGSLVSLPSLPTPPASTSGSGRNRISTIAAATRNSKAPARNEPA